MPRNVTKQLALKANLQELLRRYSISKESNTADDILAQYLTQCLEAFELAACVRDTRSRVVVEKKTHHGIGDPYKVPSL